MIKKNILELCLSPNLGGLELSVVNYFNYFNTITETFIAISPGTKLDNHVETDKKLQIKIKN